MGWPPEACSLAIDSANTDTAVKIESRHLIGFVLLLVLALVANAAENPSGAQLYAKHCAGCHNSGAVRVPPAAVLRQIPVSVIVKALQFGVMRAQASAMSSVEQISVARWLGSKSAVSISVDKLPNRCATTPALSTAAAWSNWGVTLDNTRFQTADAAGLTASDVPHLKLKWAFGFEGGTLMRSQPAVYGGRVFAAGPDLRAFSTAEGTPIWDYDTAREFNTVNAVQGKGGALDGGGAVVAGGMVLVGSGYSQWGGLPGNVLLAFSVDGR